MTLMSKDVDTVDCGVQSHRPNASSFSVKDILDLPVSNPRVDLCLSNGHFNRAERIENIEVPHYLHSSERSETKYPVNQQRTLSGDLYRSHYKSNDIRYYQARSENFSAPYPYKNSSYGGSLCGDAAYYNGCRTEVELRHRPPAVTQEPPADCHQRGEFVDRSPARPPTPKYTEIGYIENESSGMRLNSVGSPVTSGSPCSTTNHERSPYNRMGYQTSCSDSRRISESSYCEKGDRTQPHQEIDPSSQQE